MDNFFELFSNKHKGFVRSKFDRNESISNDKFPTILQLEPFHTRRSIRIDRSIDELVVKHVLTQNRPLRFHTRQLQLTSWSTVACSRLLPQQVVEIVVAPTRGGALLSITLFSLSDTRPPVGATINLHLSVLPQNTVPEGVSLPSR